MKLKTLMRNGLAGVLISAMPYGGVLAVTNTTLPIATTAPVTSPAASVSPVAAAQAQRITNLKARGTAEIDRRLANLTAAKTKLEATTRLLALDKTALTKQLTDESAALTTLKAKLGADTALADARADVASIVTDYRVYALMLPKTRLVAASDSFVTVEGNLNTLNIMLQAKVDAKKTAGKDVAAMQASLTDMKTKTAAAVAITNGLAAKLIALTPTDYNANHAVLVSYRTNLKTAQTDVKAARDDARSVVAALNAAK